MEEERIALAAAYIASKQETQIQCILDIGKYLFEEFFEGEESVFRSHHPRKQNSLRKLAQHPDVHMGVMKLFRAIQVYLHSRVYGGVPGYTWLSYSHRLMLLPVTDMSVCETLIREAYAHRWSSRELYNATKAPCKESSVPDSTSVQYKVWIHVEKVDEDNDEYEDVQEPVEVFSSPNLDEATRFVDALLEEKYSVGVHSLVSALDPQKPSDCADVLERIQEAYAERIRQHCVKPFCDRFGWELLTGWGGYILKRCGEEPACDFSDIVTGVEDIDNLDYELQPEEEEQLRKLAILLDEMLVYNSTSNLGGMMAPYPDGAAEIERGG